MWRHPRAGIFCVFAWFVLRATFQSPLQLRGDLQGIINNYPHMQCRGEWKLARVASADDVYVAASPGGYSVFSHGLCCGRPSSRPYSYAVIYRALSITIHTCSVGASGSSPALRPLMTYMWRHPRAGIFCIFAWFVLRATFQSPLQLRGGLRGDLQNIINSDPYRQCRGEWKLARVASAGDVYVGWRLLRGYSVFSHGLCFGRPSSRPYSYAMKRCGDLQCIIKDCPCKQCRGEWKLARVVHAGAGRCWVVSPDG